MGRVISDIESEKGTRTRINAAVNAELADMRKHMYMLIGIGITLQTAVPIVIALVVKK